MNTEVRPVDRLMAMYNGAMALFWAALFPGMFPLHVWPLALIAAHAGAACIPLLIRRLPERPALLTRLFREGYPLLWLGALWVELDPAIFFAHTTSFDSAIMALDIAVFGVHLDGTWMPAMPQVWFSELMHFAYWAYLPLIFVPPIVMAIRKRGDVYADITFRLMTAYVICYAIYLLFPTIGPHVYGVRYAGGPLTEGFFYGLVRSAHETGDVVGAAFPSSHVVGAVTIAWIGWRWFSPIVATLMSIEAFGVVLSTVYTQNHYAVDSIAGVVTALAIQRWAVPVVARMLAARPSRDGSHRPWPAIPPLASVPRPASVQRSGGGS
ncbi:MAG: phosphatase PAP2 family protein [Gemmatimonadota bacterium]